MQTSNPAGLTFGQSVVAVLIALFSASGWIKVWFDRKRVKPEIHKTEAETGLALAQTENVKVQTNVGAADALLRMIERVERSSINAEDTRRELEEWRDKALEADDLHGQIDLYETQMQRARADLSAANAENEVRGNLVVALLLLLAGVGSTEAQAE